MTSETKTTVPAEEREELRAAVLGTAHAGRSFGNVDVASLAEKASQAYWNERQIGASAEEAEIAALQSTQDLLVSMDMLKKARIEIGTDFRAGVFSDVAVGILVPLLLLVVPFGAYYLFDRGAAQITIIAIGIVLAIFTILSIMKVMVISGTTMRRSLIGLVPRIFESRFVLQSAGAMAFGTLAFVFSGNQLLYSLDQRLEVILAKFDEAAAITLVASRAGADLLTTRELVNKYIGADWIKLEALGTGSRAMRAQAELPSSRAEVRFDVSEDASSVAGQFTSYIMTGTTGRPHADYILGMIEASDMKQVTLKPILGESRIIDLPDGVLPPSLGTKVVVIVGRSTGKALSVQSVEGVMARLD